MPWPNQFRAHLGPPFSQPHNSTVITMRTTTVIAALLLAGAAAYECSDQDSCSDCAGLAGCGWDQYLENCKDDDHFSEGSVYVESSTACECMQANDQGCEACGDVAVFCGYVSRTGTAPLPHLTRLPLILPPSSPSAPARTDTTSAPRTTTGMRTRVTTGKTPSTATSLRPRPRRSK
jgi:hypothetical protein